MIMNISRISFCIAALLAAYLTVSAVPKHELRECDYVNTFVGTDAHGHTYPGATVPFGMVQLSPQSGKFGWDWCSGYHYSDTLLVGFAHTSLSGTGCADLGDILFLPTVGSDALDSLQHSKFSHKSEKTQPGYYSVKLLDHAIEAELTATERAGFHRYTFPGSDSAVIVLDLGYGNDDTPLEAALTVDGPTSISGHRFSSGWAREQKIFFSAEFSIPFTSVVLTKNGERQTGDNSVSGRTCKGIFFFKTKLDQQILVKVGISPVSTNGALRNLQAEIPHWAFDNVAQDALEKWQRELQKVHIETPDSAAKVTFYSALYHTLLAPTLFGDVDGQYRGGDNQVHSSREFQNYCTFSLWDTYRAAHPLYTILEPARVPDMINAILAFYRDGGLLPVWPLTGNETWCMIGYHSVPVIVDAFFKGFKGFDPKEALTAMKKSATQNRRGLEYYNLVTPLPLDKKLAELRTEDLSPGMGADTVLPKNHPVLKGWMKSDSGEHIDYHSSYPYVRSALLARATDGTMAVEWQTEPLPVNKKAATAIFMWAAGLACGKGGHRFDLLVNGQKWLSFNTARDTSQTQWSVKAENGAELTFVPQRRDRYDDLFGNMYLKVPPALQKGGQALSLKVVGEKGNSPDWYMTFEHEVEEGIRVEPEYALAKEGNTSYQFLKVQIEHISAPDSAVISLNGKAVLQAKIRTGMNTVELPIEAVTDTTPMKVSVLASGVVVDRDVNVLPVKPYGYIPADKERESVSKALEYAYDDWCIAQMAQALNQTDDYELFMKRSAFYRNLYDSTSGFMRGRNSDGSWVTPFDPRFGTEKQPQYTEGNAWQYSWYVPQNAPDMIALMGGKQRFTDKLDSLFNHSSDLEGMGAVADMSGLVGLYAQGNEPSHHIAYLYDFAGQPWKTQQRVRQIMKDFFTSKPDGLCGNEDCGQMSAWYIFSSLGFYPVNPADQKYYLGSPLYPKAVVDVGGGKRFTVETVNNSAENVFVQSVTLNGAPLTKPYITHDDLVKGGSLVMQMGPNPNEKLTWDK
jgi:putative alpha-1,2-mannosidase